MVTSMTMWSATDSSTVVLPVTRLIVNLYVKGTNIDDIMMITIILPVIELVRNKGCVGQSLGIAFVQDVRTQKLTRLKEFHSEGQWHEP